MHGRQLWRRMVLGRQTDRAVGSAVGRRALVRVILLAMCLALVGQGTAQPVGAGDNDPHGAGTANVLVCEAAGGTAEVHSHSSANGYYASFVECNGGLLDGWGCTHDTVKSWDCSVEYTPPPPGKGKPIDLGALGLAPEVLAAVPPGALPGLVAPITEAGTPGVGAPGNDEVLPSAVATTNDAGSRVVDAPGNDQDQDANTGKKGKGKKGKKGKKNGKRRR